MSARTPLDVIADHVGLTGPDRDAARAILSALRAAGYAVVPREPTTDMLQDGQRAARKARRPSVSGMTIDSQVRAECAVEAAIYRAMLATGEATP